MKQNICRIMNVSSSDTGFLSSFFQLPQGDSASGKNLEALARIHSYILITIHHEAASFLKDENLDDEELLAGYVSMLNERTDSEAPLSFAVSEFIQNTLGSKFRLSFDSTRRILASHQNQTFRMFPFFLVGPAGTICWLQRCRAGVLCYQDSTGTILTIESTNPVFLEVIEGLLEQGWYRTVLRVLGEIPEAGRKNFSNKIYTAHCFLACEFYKQKRYQEAIAEFEQALQIRTNVPQLYYNLALSYARIKAYRTAIQLLNQLNRVKPDQSRTFELLGDFHMQIGDPERSIVLYQKAEELSQNKPPLHQKIKRAEENGPRLRNAETKKEKEEEKEEKFVIQSCLQDLTLEAELGRFRPVLGREKEILQMQEILACQAKKNVLVLGDPGVGKTALIQELAFRMVAGKVSPRFQSKKLVRLNLGSLLAGAKFRGQFEERLMQLIREIKKMDCILFIDDIHQIASGGAGKTGSTEAAQFLKPALANDEIRVIGATNMEEFRNNLEKDSSLIRCFQVVKLSEPDHETLLKILRTYRTQLENYHRVLIGEECLETVIMWVKVLLRDRALPDKALDILDRTAARVSIHEKSSVVSSESVLETISEISNVPLNRMSVSEKIHYRNIDHFLSRRVVGQPEAIRTVSRVICTSKLQMTLNPVRPKGIFLFVGPTGVGKTELARAMAEFLFGDEEKIIRIDMSEYMERYSASRLIGTSPGYVGYYDQNQLVDRIRANPYSLILLDEIEKADSQLLNIFLQVFDAGRLTDGKGKVAYFDNATIVMTSNIGTHLFAQNKLGYGPDAGQVRRSELLKEAKRFFQPEFLNRIDEIVFFQPLTQENVREIAALKLEIIFEQLAKQGKELTIEDEAMSRICRIGYDYEYGARNLERVLRRHLLDKIAELALTADWPSIRTISARWVADEIVLETPGIPGLQEIVSAPLEQQNYLEE